MPTFDNRESLASVRDKINAAIRYVDGFTVPQVTLQPYPSYAAMIGDAALTPAACPIGTRVQANGLWYEATDDAIVNGYPILGAGGVKLYVLPNRGAIQYEACGPVLDTESLIASTANQAAMTAAIAAAIRAGVEDIILPPGTIWTRADNGTNTGSGLRVVVPNNKTIRFWGSAGTVIKRIALSPPLTLAASSAMVWMTANTGITIEWHHVTFDGNEANCEFDAGNLYAEEQSANLRWLTGSGTPNAIRFFNCDVGKGRVGDGYMANIRTHHFMASDCSTTDTSVRRVRADWQFSRYATHETIMANIVCNSWESEPADTQAGARLILTNVHARSVFDLAGDATNASGNRQPILATLTNVVCLADASRAGLPFVNFFRVRGTAVNCQFRLIDRIQRCKITFIGGEITVADNGGGAADAVQIWHDQATEATNTNDADRFGYFAVFDRVTFLKDATVTTGEYLSTETTTTSAGQLGPEMVRTSVIDCNTPEPLDTFMRASRAGLVEVRGGLLRASDAIVSYSNDGTFYHRLVIEPTTLWAAPDLIRIPSGINVTGSIIEVSGEWDGDAMGAVDSGAVVSADNVTWRTNGVMHLAASPAGSKTGIPGLIARVRGRAIGLPFEYRFTNPSGYGQTTWAAIPTSPARNTTANRPTLSSSDIGQTYLDTTLDPDGLTIWWNGTAWVDATGAVR